MAAGAAVWVVLVVAGLYVRELGWASVAFGVLILLTARGMILRIARKEGVAVWLACLVVPLYSVFFAFAHFRQAANALLLAFFGYGYLVSGFVVFEVHDAIDAVNAMPAAADPDEDDGDDELQKVAAAKVMAGIDSLTLTVDGKQTRVAVNQLTCVEANLRQGAAADAFEFSGPDVSLRGSFPSEFHGEWGRATRQARQNLAPERSTSAGRFASQVARTRPRQGDRRRVRGLGGDDRWAADALRRNRGRYGRTAKAGDDSGHVSGPRQSGQLSAWPFSDRLGCRESGSR